MNTGMVLTKCTHCHKYSEYDNLADGMVIACSSCDRETTFYFKRINGRLHYCFTIKPSPPDSEYEEYPWGYTAEMLEEKNNDSETNV